MSWPLTPDDTMTPAYALDLAGQGVRGFNHRSFARPELGREGWQFASDQYRALGELTYLAGGLRQALQQIGDALGWQLEQRRLGLDGWGAAAGKSPGGCVAEAHAELEAAAAAAGQLYGAVSRAQNAIASVCNVDPEPAP